MPVFTASQPKSETTASICAVTKSSGTTWTPRDADGVLRGQRGDRRGAVDAMRGESLQIGLDSGSGT